MKQMNLKVSGNWPTSRTKYCRMSLNKRHTYLEQSAQYTLKAEGSSTAEDLRTATEIAPVKKELLDFYYLASRKRHKVALIYASDVRRAVSSGCDNRGLRWFACKEEEKIEGVAAVCHCEGRFSNSVDRKNSLIYFSAMVLSNAFSSGYRECALLTYTLVRARQGATVKSLSKYTRS